MPPTETPITNRHCTATSGREPAELAPPGRPDHRQPPAATLNSDRNAPRRVVPPVRTQSGQKLSTHPPPAPGAMRYRTATAGRRDGQNSRSPARPTAASLPPPRPSAAATPARRQRTATAGGRDEQSSHPPTAATTDKLPPSRPAAAGPLPGARRSPSAIAPASSSEHAPWWRHVPYVTAQASPDDKTGWARTFPRPRPPPATRHHADLPPPPPARGQRRAADGRRGGQSS